MEVAKGYAPLAENREVRGKTIRHGEQQVVRHRTLAASPPPTLAKPTPATPAPHLVIQNGTISLYVTDVPGSQAKVEAIAKKAGGYVSTANLYDAGGNEKHAAIQIRVPVAKFQETLDAVRTLGEVADQQISGNDVTGQVADSEGRIKSLSAEADQLRQLVRQAKNVDEVLRVRDRLSQVDQELQGLAAQKSALSDQAAMSTLTVDIGKKPKPYVPQPLVEDPPPPSWMERTFGDAAATFSNLFQMVIGLLAQLLALSPIWVPLLGLSYWAWKVSESKRGY